MLHFKRLRDRNSKVYTPNQQSIVMNEDREHETITQQVKQEVKVIQQKKQIDKIMQSIIKQRMFGNFFKEQARTSIENHYDLERIVRVSMHRPRANTNLMNRTLQVTSQRYARTRPFSRKESQANDFNRTIDFAPKLQSQKSKRLEILPKMATNSNRYSKTLDYESKNRIAINQKALKKSAAHQSFIHDPRLSRQLIINRNKNVVKGKLLERFFHFFGFPLNFSFRQYCSLIENAANTSLRLVYFWVFSLMDENANGLLTSQDLFRFFQNFQDNSYIQKQIFALNKAITRLGTSPRKQQKENEQHIEQMLVVNHNLRLQEVKDMLKRTGKQLITAQCVKNTCYHQMVLSLEHDTLERLKINHIESTELQTKKITDNRMTENKKKTESSPGLRLRDIYGLFGNKRPKIFCYFLHLLTGESAELYQ